MVDFRQLGKTNGNGTTEDDAPPGEPSAAVIQAETERIKQQHLEDKRFGLTPFERRMLDAARELAPNGGPLASEAVMRHAKMGFNNGYEALAKLKNKGLWIWTRRGRGSTPEFLKETKTRPSTSTPKPKKEPSLLEKLHQRQKEAAPVPVPIVTVSTNQGPIETGVTVDVVDGQIVVAFRLPFADFITWASGQIRGTHQENP